MGGHVAYMRNAYKIVVGKPYGKGPLRRPRDKWEYITRMDLRERGGKVWIDASGSGYGPVADSYEHENEPLDFTKYGEFLD
jgi:hypothetical protein